MFESIRRSEDPARRLLLEQQVMAAPTHFGRNDDPLEAIRAHAPVPRQELGADARLEGNTVVGRIPMRFQPRGGRKRIVAPDGSEIALASKPQPDGTLAKALARSWRWQKLLEDGCRLRYRAGTELGLR
jgi:hypothetical protein